MNIGMIFTWAAVIIILFIIYSLIFTSHDTKFAILNLLRHKRRTFSTLFAMILGGISIYLYGGFIDYSFWILQQQTVRTNIGHVQIFNESYFNTANKNKSIIEDYQSLKQAIVKDKSLATFIDTLSGQLEFTGVISQYENETSSYFSAIGIDPLAALKLGSFDRLVSGSDLSRIKNDEITLGQGLANTLNANYNNWVDVLTVNAQGGQGALSLKVRGIFSSGIKDYDDVTMKVPLLTAQRLMNTDGVSKIVVLLKDEKDLDLFTTHLKQFISTHHLPLIVKDWKELSIFYQQVNTLLSGIYFFIKVVVALIVVFMISNSLSMNILERTREITTLRAIGLKSLRVSRLFLLEGIFIGMLGALGSLLIGFSLAEVINLKGISMPPSPGQTQGYTAFIKTDNLDLVWITLLLPVITATLASIIPALKVAKLNISDAFKSS